MKILLIFISFLFLNNSNAVHQDTPLKIDKNGNIIGLPKKFGPAKFNFEKKKLRINNKKVIFPKCLNSFFEKHENPKLNLSASWYHSKEIMPYYLNFSISDTNSKYTYGILVDLETLELIYVNKSFMEGNHYYSPEIELKKECLRIYKKGIKTLN